LIVCSIIFIIVAIPFRYFFPVLNISQLRPSSALPPAFGMMFGFWGALGAALGDLVSDIIIGYPLVIVIFGFIANFLFGYISYKLWYSFNIGDKLTKPRLDTLNNLLKFIIVITITSLIMTALLSFLLESVGILSFVSLQTLIFLLANFDFSMILGILIISIANIYGIKMYSPKQKKAFINPKVFDFSLGLATLIGLSYFLYSIFNGSGVYGIYIGIIFYVLIFIYIFKPFNKKIITENKEITLTEKFILVFILTGTIISILTGIEGFYSIQITQNQLINFWNHFYMNMSFIIIIFYISFIGFLYYIEKNITNPIESISSSVNEYTNSKNKIEDSNNIVKKLNSLQNKQIEIEILAESFEQMIKDLKLYILDLKNITAEKERINTELNIATNIQKSILPKEFLTSQGNGKFDISATSYPAKEVGGDFYDFFFIDDDHVAIVIGDVSGKGIPAALFMMLAKTLIKKEALYESNPKNIFKNVNNQLARDNSENMFVTAWMGILEIKTAMLTYVNAGHNPPLLKTSSRYKPLKSKPNFVLGPIDDIDYIQNEIKLEKGARIFLYTDGITEAINSKKEFFGEKNLINILNNSDLPIRDLLVKIKEECDEFSKNLEQFDDITMLILEYKI
jgi:sigma-B regulation protein RsbU (phosphoserine phosphatase)